MGKIVTVYLTDEEVAELKAFCDENRCTQHSAMKTGLKELLHKSIKGIEESPTAFDKEENTENGFEDDEMSEKKTKEISNRRGQMRGLLQRLVDKERQQRTV